MGGNAIEINDAEFEKFIEKNSAVVIDCWAPWCGPCRMVGPVVDELAGEMKGKVAFAKLNVDNNQGTSQKYRIMSIPTLLYFKDGQLKGQSVGAMPKDMLKQEIERHLG